ncbi:hypothetical protein DM02DRAFT_666355 [Periconia macrospinosa]|uniref:Uncharacterized protein n=1 Tax=Periconia macrospinosa TaxID=97972 RepID=A0A2V1EEZ5_9PLEO|nr:hypothetical protein DM02DRAFT_666355 [Periconia macrospinosa]
MATKLCCTAVDESRTSSPQLPNAPITEATPVRLPLTSHQTQSQSSRFTSAQTGDLCEIRDIFQNASGNLPSPSPPIKAGRARFIKPSLYSLHSLHKMKSVHSLIRRKLSKDLSKKSSSEHARASGAAKNIAAGATGIPDIASKHSKGPPNLQLKLTRFDLKENLLSDKQPHEGGYDPDAEVLDDIGKNMGKRPLKRPSLHNIEWSPSTASIPTPESSSKSRHSQPVPQLEPYQIKRQSKSLSTPLPKIFSSPDLQITPSNTRERKQRRSHSATSVELPAPSPLSPLRLPSLRGTDIEGIAWSAALNESLRLSQIPVSSEGRVPVAQSKASFEVPGETKTRDTSLVKLQTKGIPTPDIRVQEPTATSTPRPSTSLPCTIRVKSRDAKDQTSKAEDDEDYAYDDPRASIHLHSMRISHHLRSESLLSWENLKDPSELSAHIRHPLRDGSNSDLSQSSRMQTQLSRHNRQTSSSGFASSNVPSKWGRVISNEIREDKSSIYSSRPQSPPDGCGSSLTNAAKPVNPHEVQESVPSNDPRLRRSNSSSAALPIVHKTPADPPKLASFATSINQLSSGNKRLARSNSSSSTKKSKFREEFSPSPPKRRITASVSIMRLLNPKRSSLRSRSEANIRPSVDPSVDGSPEATHTTCRERRLSRSMVSLEREQEALGKDQKCSPMWEKALATHQDERAAFFVSKDRNLAVMSSPFRERSASVARIRHSVDSNTPPSETNSLKRFSAPPFSPPSPDDAARVEHDAPSGRRIAIVGKNATDMSFSDEIQRCFDQQSDSIETVGAWGRYPSHSRDERTLSAGHLDSVQTRDFALEAAINFATGKDRKTREDGVDPAERPVSPPLLPGEKKRKKKIGNMRMVKSNSMTFGKSFLRNYTKLFKSQSIEFQKHGRGHRSSISSGGTLEYPELELLPDVWRRGIIEERSGEHSHSSSDNKDENEGHDSGKKGKEMAREQDSRSTLRPLNSIISQPESTVPGLDGQLDLPPVKDNARVLSAYYENCLPTYPRASVELDCGREDFGVPSRRSFDSKCVSMHTRTLPGRFPKHSRNESRVSRFSVVSTASMRPSFVSSGENQNSMDQVSIASVRRSTMDLIAIYKEQEVTEREKVLSLMRAESKKENQMLAGL